MKLIRIVALALAAMLFPVALVRAETTLFDNFEYLDTLASGLSGEAPDYAAKGDAGTGAYGFAMLFNSYGFSVALGTGEMHTYRYIAQGQQTNVEDSTWLPVSFDIPFGLAGRALDTIKANASDYLARTIIALTDSDLDVHIMCNVIIGIICDDAAYSYYYTYNMLTDELKLSCSAK